MAELDLKVDVDVRGADKLSSLGRTLGGIGRAAVIGAGVVGAAGVAAGVSFLKMASDAADAQAKVDNTFEQMGAAAFTSIDALNEHAEALAKATVFDDETIKEAQATLLSFGQIGEESFGRATEAAADMAAFFETDIQSASVQLGKALNDPIKGVTALNRMGVQFTDDQKAMIASLVETGDVAGAQAIILAEVEQQVGNTATALNQTPGGQLQQAMEDLGEAGEAIGTSLLPLMPMLSEALQGFAAFVTANMPAIQGVFQTVFGAIGTAISFLFTTVIPTLVSIFQGAVGWITSNMPTIQGTVGGVFDTISGVISVFTQNVLPVLLTIFQQVVGWITSNMPLISSVAGQVFGAIENIIKAVSPIIEALATHLFPVVGAAASVLFEVMDVAFKGIGGAFEVLGEIFDTVGGLIKDIFKSVVGVVKGIWNTFVGFWNGIEISVPSVDVPFVGKLGGFSIGVPDLPMLAEGGIVTAPTLALIGERGPEAVVPLDGQHGMGGVNIEVNVLGDLRAETPEEVASAIGRSLWSSGITDQTVFAAGNS